MAASGDTLEISGRPFESFLEAISVEIEIICAKYNKCGVNAGEDVVGHNAEPAGKLFQFANGRRLPDIEKPEQKKRAQPGFPVERGCASDGDPLPDDFIDNYEVGIFHRKVSSNSARRPRPRCDQRSGKQHEYEWRPRKPV